ncbi:NAD-dependent epimerase/dehydratase (fragment) [Thiomonas sp. X19]|uniref:NAD-dependent epimerase/dehydratase family protein n=1 Tax=Thiomonas sp. X19 TaxID=1050370 RepID=UPI000B6587C6
MSETILITGLQGFTGRYLASALRKRGARTVGLVQSAAGVELGSTDAVYCDLTDAQAVRAAVAQVRPTQVGHLAALSFVGHAEAAGAAHRVG